MTKAEALDLIKSDGIYSQEVMDALEQTGHCKDCKSFREIPYHIDICNQHTELCPKGDWYCADFEPQESDN